VRLCVARVRVHGIYETANRVPAPLRHDGRRQDTPTEVICTRTYAAVGHLRPELPAESSTSG